MTRSRQFRFAHYDVSTLYKFRGFRTADQRTWVKQILLEDKIYFSRASDPEDLRPIVQLRPYPTERELRAALVAEAERIFPTRFPPLPPGDLDDWIRRAREDPLDIWQERALQSAHSHIESEYWIYSLSANPDSYRMWRYYADECRGLCIHFSTETTSPFCIAQPVVYALQRPPILFPFDLDPSEFAALALCTKTWRHWRYQREYRFIKYADTRFDEVGLHFEDQFARIPPTAVTGITLGPEMPQNDIDEIVALVNQRRVRVPIYSPGAISMRTHDA